MYQYMYKLTEQHIKRVYIFLIFIAKGTRAIFYNFPFINLSSALKLDLDMLEV
jgi:hypothetical protein